MKKILVIGAGIGQIPIIQLAKDEGMYVITLSTRPNEIALSLSDEHISIDIFDLERVVEVAKEKNIDAVISDQNDMMMPTVAYVAEKLNLPGNTYSQAIAYSNKNTFRNNCMKLGIPSPRHILVTDSVIPIEFMDIPLPWIIKPEDSQSSLGVSKIDSLDEYSKFAEIAIGFSNNKRAILEEFFEGVEVVCEGFIYKGSFHLLGFADREYFNLDKMMIPSQTIFPSNLPKDILEKIVSCESKMARYINPQFGIVHAEYLVNVETREIRVVESALRGGGVYISSHLVPYSTGININKVLLDCVIGKEIDIDNLFKMKEDNAASYLTFYLPEGVIEDVQGVEDVERMSVVEWGG